MPRRIDWRLILWYALPLTVLSLELVTLRWDEPGDGGPAYGFPLPFTTAGPNSLQMLYDPMALAIAALVYLAASLAVVLLLSRLLPVPRTKAGGLASTGARWVFAATAVVWFGFHALLFAVGDWRFTTVEADGPKSFWVGPPASY